MPKITLKSQKINLIKKYSTRAKSIRISIKNWELILTIPKPWFFQTKNSVEKKALDFLESKADWILKHMKKNDSEFSSEWQNKNPDLNINSREHYLKNKEKARKLCEEKCEFWAEKIGVRYNRISIKSLKTKWGSCSSKKNLNFSYKILFLKPKDQDYLIVHELSHLVHMNHSKNFWYLVCKTLWSEEFRRYKINN